MTLHNLSLTTGYKNASRLNAFCPPLLFSFVTQWKGSLHLPVTAHRVRNKKLNICSLLELLSQVLEASRILVFSASWTWRRRKKRRRWNGCRDTNKCIALLGGLIFSAGLRNLLKNKTQQQKKIKIKITEDLQWCRRKVDFYSSSCVPVYSTDVYVDVENHTRWGLHTTT